MVSFWSNLARARIGSASVRVSPVYGTARLALGSARLRSWVGSIWLRLGSVRHRLRSVQCKGLLGSPSARLGFGLGSVRFGSLRPRSARLEGWVFKVGSWFRQPGCTCQPAPATHAPRHAKAADCRGAPPTKQRHVRSQHHRCVCDKCLFVNHMIVSIPPPKRYIVREQNN